MEDDLYLELIQWMRSVGIINTYKRNMILDGEFNNIQEAMVQGKGFISHCFIWDSTQEGSAYWDTINGEFLDWFLRRNRE